MRLRAIMACALLCVASLANANGLDALRANAIRVDEAGSIAAGFDALSHSRVAPAAIDAAFAHLGPDILDAARQWARDAELRDAPPAFRRFLFFEYLTKDTSIVAGASNPDDRLINIDAAVDSFITDERVVQVASALMTQSTTAPVFTTVADYLLATFPMIPPAAKAQVCRNCHASTEVNRPYPPDTRVLGYTFVLQPLAE